MFFIMDSATNATNATAQLSSLFSTIQNFIQPNVAQYSPTLFITYALYLAGLTYFLGVLIYMLPIPFEGLKEWGPNLIKDAIYVTVWVSIYQYVLNFATYLLTLIGASWSSFLSSVLTDFAILLGLDFAFAFVSSGALNSLSGLFGSGSGGSDQSTGGTVPGGVNDVSSKFNLADSIAKFISGTGIPGVAASLIQDLFLFYLALVIIVLLIYHGATLLTTIGIFLMALPFRIGRKAGSVFIAMSLVYYVGLPLMPAFDTLLASIAYGGTMSVASLNAGTTIFSIFGYGVSYIAALLSYLLVYYFVARAAFIILLGSIATGLADAIGESGELPIKIEKLI